MEHCAKDTVAIDCEFVSTEHPVRRQELSWVCIIDGRGRKLMDEKVRTRFRVTNYKSHISGCRESDMKEASDFFTVQRKVAKILGSAGRIVGHTLDSDFEKLDVLVPDDKVRDVADHPEHRPLRGGRWALKNLARHLGELERKVLDVKTFQTEDHNPYDDALAALLIFYDVYTCDEYYEKTPFDPTIDISGC